MVDDDDEPEQPKTIVRIKYRVYISFAQGTAHSSQYMLVCYGKSNMSFLIIKTCAAIKQYKHTELNPNWIDNVTHFATYHIHHRSDFESSQNNENNKRICTHKGGNSSENNSNSFLVQIENDYGNNFKTISHNSAFISFKLVSAISG